MRAVVPAPQQGVARQGQQGARAHARRMPGRRPRRPAPSCQQPRSVTPPCRALPAPRATHRPRLPRSKARPHPRVFCRYVFTSLLGQFAVYISLLMWVQHRAHEIMPKVGAGRCRASCWAAAGGCWQPGCGPLGCGALRQRGARSGAAACKHARGEEGSRSRDRKLTSPAPHHLRACPAGGAPGARRRLQAQPHQHSVLPGQLCHPGGCWAGCSRADRGQGGSASASPPPPGQLCPSAGCWAAGAPLPCRSPTRRYPPLDRP